MLGNKIHCFLWKNSKLVDFVNIFCSDDNDHTTVISKLEDGNCIAATGIARASSPIAIRVVFCVALPKHFDPENIYQKSKKVCCFKL